MKCNAPAHPTSPLESPRDFVGPRYPDRAPSPPGSGRRRAMTAAARNGIPVGMLGAAPAATVITAGELVAATERERAEALRRQRWARGEDRRKALGDTLMSGQGHRSSDRQEAAESQQDTTRGPAAPRSGQPRLASLAAPQPVAVPGGAVPRKGVSAPGEVPGGSGEEPQRQRQLSAVETLEGTRHATVPVRACAVSPGHGLSHRQAPVVARVEGRSKMGQEGREGPKEGMVPPRGVEDPSVWEWYMVQKSRRLNSCLAAVLDCQSVELVRGIGAPALSAPRRCQLTWVSAPGTALRVSPSRSLCLPSARLLRTCSQIGSVESGPERRLTRLRRIGSGGSRFTWLAGAPSTI